MTEFLGMWSQPFAGISHTVQVVNKDFEKRSRCHQTNGTLNFQNIAVIAGQWVVRRRFTSYNQGLLSAVRHRNRRTAHRRVRVPRR